MKHARINVAPIDAWEEWLIEVPDDADEAWIEENFDDIVEGRGGQLLTLLDSGNHGYDAVDVLSVGDGE